MNAIASARRRRFSQAAWMTVVLLSGAIPTFAQNPASVAPKPVASDHEMRHKYVWSTLGFDGVVGATWASGLEQWKDSPPEWGADRTGYARRWASDFAESSDNMPAISITLERACPVLD